MKQCDHAYEPLIHMLQVTLCGCMKHGVRPQELYGVIEYWMLVVPVTWLATLPQALPAMFGLIGRSNTG